MSEPYRVNAGHIYDRVDLADRAGELGGLEYIRLLSQLALVERLERLVAVLEQIRDRLPGQIAK